MYHIDIQQEFMATMDGLDAWISEKLKEPNPEGRVTREPSHDPG